MTKLTKSQRKQVRELIDLAHSRELSDALTSLEGEFRRWRAEEINAFELDELIHEHHQGASRKIWKRYSSTSHWEIALPGALHLGTLTREDFPADLWDEIGPRIEEIKNGLFS